MQTINQNYLDYIEATKGMSKADIIKLLIDLIEKSNNEFYIYFGSYYQFTKSEGKFIKEPLLWKVLNYETIKDDGFLLLLSKYLIDTLHFSYENNNYRTSTIREDLNNYFYNKAFTKIDKKKIISTIIEDYTDNVFLLAKEDYENPNYFIDDNSRKASCTDYAIALMGYQSKTTLSGTYWTRSSRASKSSKAVVIINHYGKITSWRPYHTCPGWHHSFSAMAYETVRPAIRIRL
ncbi:MAG: DUF6273 domain-containing protein [Acholeplasmataceae bacterium]|nr:DUF6273 domain-containing protein [Acholeplasmataceae bacterium]